MFTWLYLRRDDVIVIWDVVLSSMSPLSDSVVVFALYCSDLSDVAITPSLAAIIKWWTCQCNDSVDGASNEQILAGQ